MFLMFPIYSNSVLNLNLIVDFTTRVDEVDT